MAERGTLGSAEAYSIAWIAPLPHHRTAAAAVLDERHNEPHGFSAQKHELDRNSYSWGRIGHHCVVIASLPSGQYEDSNAAVTVRGLYCSLPHIRFALVVGTAAGLPGEKVKSSGETVARRDIRLGDVIVGSLGADADDTTAGVVQYEWNSTGDQPLLVCRKNFSQPPPALRAGLLALQSEHELDGSKFPQILETALQRFPNIKKLYSNPGVEKEWDEEDSDSDSDSDDELPFTPDRLFKGSYAHVGGNDCGRCESTGELKRKRRKVTTPKIHFGTTVLLPTAVQEARRRDQIVASLGEGSVDAICLDSETFGLPGDEFPCLLIKGVCHYGDEHRYDRWQKYAALSAAAFAKELLGFVGAGDVEKATRIGKAVA